MLLSASIDPLEIVHRSWHGMHKMIPQEAASQLVRRTSGRFIGLPVPADRIGWDLRNRVKLCIHIYILRKAPLGRTGFVSVRNMLRDDPLSGVRHDQMMTSVVIDSKAEVGFCSLRRFPSYHLARFDGCIRY